MNIIEEDKIISEKQKEAEEQLKLYQSYIGATYAKLAKLTLQDLRESRKDSVLFSRYKKEDVIKWLEKPETYVKQIREACLFLYSSSNHFRRLISYFSTMHLLAYIVVPYGAYGETINKKMFKSSFLRAVRILDKMNIQHELQSVLTVGFREDTYYGYVYETEDSFFLRQLPYIRCMISTIEDGVYNFAFDFSLFDLSSENPEKYGEEFVEKYKLYKGDKKLRWQELDSTKTMAIKVNQDLSYNIPPFAGVLEAIYALEDYRSLFLAKTELENTKLLSFKIPLDENNRITMDDTMRQKFYAEIGQELPGRVGYLISPFEVTTHSFEKSVVGADTISIAESEFYNSAGVSSFIFNNEKASSASLTQSINSDFGIVKSVMKQIERWINRKLKQEPGKFKFKCQFLDVSIYNQEAMFKLYKETATLGLPTKMALAAILGYSPSDTLNMGLLEEELDIRDTLFSKPLLSSNTQSIDGGDEGGRPEKDEGDLGDDGEKTKDSGANDNRV